MNKIELGIFAGLGLAGTLIFAMWRIGDETLRTLALLFIGGIVAIGLLAASALPIRAYRKKDATDTTHHYHDGTKTVIERRILDGRAQGDVRLLQLPQTGSQQVFPEMLRAAYQSGMLAKNGTASQPQPTGETIEGEVLREWEPGEWTGEIE